jgi:hypothetical protein
MSEIFCSAMLLSYRSGNPIQTPKGREAALLEVTGLRFTCGTPPAISLSSPVLAGFHTGARLSLSLVLVVGFTARPGVNTDRRWVGTARAC